MLQDFREKIQGNLAKVIIAFICIPFAFFGIESFFSGGGNTDIAKVGDVSISQTELDEAIFLRKRQMINQMGENIDYSLLEDSKLRQPALDSLIDTQLLVNSAKTLGFVISDEQIFAQIIKDPNFQIDGKFSNDRFRFLVKQSGLSEEIYIRLSKNEFLIQQLYSGFIGAEFLTREDDKLYAQLSNETRDIASISLSLNDAMNKIVLNNQELEDYYQINKERFRANETVVLEYLTVEKNHFIEPASSKEVEKAYQDELSRFSPKDTYKLAHIQITFDENTSRDAANEKIKKIQSKLADGESFDKLAKEFSDDLGTKSNGGNLGSGSKDIFPKEFIDALKTLSKGDISEPITLDSSFHLVKLVNLTKDLPPSFADRKDSLKKEIELINAEPAFRNAEETLRDLSFNSPNLVEPAKALKIKTKTTDALTRKEVIDFFGSPQISQAIFSDEVLLDGQNSDVYETTEDSFTTVRVKQHNKPEILAFDLVKSQIESILTREKAESLLDNEIQLLKSEIITSTETPYTLAKKHGYTYKKQDNVKRADSNLMERTILNAAFRSPHVSTPDQAAISIATLSNGDKVLVLANNAKLGKADSLTNSEKRSLGIILSQSKGNSLFNDYQDYLKNHTKIKIL